MKKLCIIIILLFLSCSVVFGQCSFFKDDYGRIYFRVENNSNNAISVQVVLVNKYLGQMRDFGAFVLNSNYYVDYGPNVGWMWQPGEYAVVYINGYPATYENPYGNNPSFGQKPSFTKTSKSVAVYTEFGVFKGNYAIYSSGGQQYIFFPNKNSEPIRVQGKNAFTYQGNRYVLYR